MELFTPLSKPEKTPIYEKNAILEESKNRIKKTVNGREPRITRVIHKPTYCVITERTIDGESIPHERKELSPFRAKNDVISSHSVSRLSQAIHWLLLFADKKRVYSRKENKTFSFRLAFITLTLSDRQAHTDKEIKEHLLQPFLYWLTRYHQASYVWKAETQLNGNIHFHITIDTFVHWKSIRAKWNNLLAKYKYCKVFNDGSNDKGDSATQIKAVINEKQTSNYITDYIRKKNTYREEKYRDIKPLQDHRPCNPYSFATITLEDVCTRENYLRFIGGRLWGTSESLSNINCFLEEHDTEFIQSESFFFRNNDVKRLSTVLLKKAEEEYSTMPASDREILKKTSFDLRQQFSKFANVYIHPNLRFSKLPPLLSSRIAEEKLNRKFHNQKYFTTESFF